MDKTEIRSLIETWRGGSRTSEGIEANDRLLELGSVAYDELILGLDHDDAGVREGCAWTLGGLGDPRAIEHLGRMVKDPDYRVRSDVAWSLGRIGRPECLPLLNTLLDDDIGTEGQKRIVHEEASASIRRIEGIMPTAFGQKYKAYEAIWNGLSFDDVDLRSLIMELPVLSQGAIHPLKGRFERQHMGDVDSLCNTMKDILRNDVHRARARSELKDCFIRPDGPSGYWELYIHYCIAPGKDVLAPYVVARSGADEFWFFAGVIWE